VAVAGDEPREVMTMVPTEAGTDLDHYPRLSYWATYRPGKVTVDSRDESGFPLVYSVEAIRGEPKAGLPWLCGPAPCGVTHATAEDALACMASGRAGADRPPCPPLPLTGLCDSSRKRGEKRRGPAIGGSD
jgi:hypothetical protein